MTDPMGLDTALAKLERHLLAQWSPIPRLDDRTPGGRSVGRVRLLIDRMGIALGRLFARILVRLRP
jgi:hypothetical protein